VNEHTQQLPSAVELLGTDASGANVFFATTESLVQQDRNTGEDYYDARICTGSERCPATTDEPGAPVCVEGCQANASRTGTVASPASITFEGPGNLPVPMVKPAAKPKAKVLTRAQRLAKALKACKRDKSKKKRSSCEKSAHKKFGRGK
jgi:Fe-S-cluster-containing dehydrogenase component